MDVDTHAYVQNLIRQEGRSMLQYVSESFPWTTPENAGFWPEIMELVREEKVAAEGLTRLLLRHRGRPAFLGAYPMSFTNINFISLDHLLPRLAKFQKGRIEELEKDVARILHEETRIQVRQVLEMKKRHLGRLEDLIQRRPSPNLSDRR